MQDESTRSRGAQPVTDLPPVVLGDYEIESVLTRKATSTVYRGRKTSSGIPVAVKVIRPASARDGDALRAAFEREVEVLSSLAHPNVVRLLDHGEVNGHVLVMVQPLLSGPTLESLVGAAGRLPSSRVVPLGLQLAAALAEVHRLGVVHRDVKPANMIVEARETGEDRLTLLDFGLVQAQGTAGRPPPSDRGRPGASAPPPMTAAVGTPHYVAPEQALGEPVDVRTDLYSVGAVLFFCLTGRHPFEGGSVAELVAAHVGAPVPDPRDHDAEIPVGLAVTVTRCLAKRPEDRWPDARALREALLGAA